MPRAPRTKPRKVGKRIKAWRLNLGLSQRDVSTPGITAAYLSRIEKGDRDPSYEALVQIAAPLGTTGLGLLTGDEDAHCPFCLRGVA